MYESTLILPVNNNGVFFNDEHRAYIYIYVHMGSSTATQPPLVTTNPASLGALAPLLLQT